MTTLAGHPGRVLPLWLAISVALCCSWQANCAGARPPNIVLIIADDLGYRELGCFGQQRIQTPHLDRLAKQGMRLTQHYSGNAVCAPSRCVLMTGQHPGHAWVRSNRELKPEGQFPLRPDEITLAKLLRDQGYTTGAFGKWGLGGPGSKGDPLNQGFDRFFGYNCQRHAHSYYPDYLWSDAQRIPLDNDPPVPGHAFLAAGADSDDPASYERFKGADYAPDHINEHALKFIRQHQDEPFLLYYPTVIPHLALHVPDEQLGPYLQLGWHDPPLKLIRGKGGGYTYTPHFSPRAAYAAMITRMDQYVGNVLNLLEELGLAEETIVVFSSDNGATHANREVDVDFFASVGELRGLKGSLYEGGIRVPTIVRWPRRISADSVSGRISGFEDWLPTLLELVSPDRPWNHEVDGVSFAPTLLGKSQAARPPLYREFAGYGGQQSVRDGDWKAIRTNIKRGNHDVELYDLATDVGEKNDLAGKHPDVVARLERLMIDQHTPSAAFPLGWLDE